MARYKVLSELGRGGMGVVYRVLQCELNREVAMKVVLGGKDEDPRYLIRFEREIDALIRLEHPNIVRIYDKGSSDGNPFFTMELVKGKCLHDVIERGGPMAPDRIAHVMTQVVDALDYVHQRGIIHRDIKPRNIMLCDEDHAVVMDFGLILDPQKTALTGHGAMVGTPRYMAPETVTDVLYTPGTDLYAVGLVAYEMAVGFPAVPKNPSLELMVASIVRDSPRPIREIRPDFPAELEAILFALIEKKPGKRPSVPEILRMLADFKEGQPTGLPPVPVSPPGARPASKTGKTALTAGMSGSTPAVRVASRWGPALALGALGMSVVSGLVIFVTQGPAGPAASAASPSPGTPAPASPAEEPEPSTAPLDLEAETVRLEILGSKLEKSFRIQGGEDGSTVLRSLRSIENAGEMVTLLLDGVSQLDHVLAAAFAADRPGKPDILYMVRAGQAILGAVQSYYTYEAKSDALRDRVLRLTRHIDPAEKDPFRKAIGGTLQAQVELAARPSLNGHEKMADAFIAAYDLTRDAHSAWRRTPEATWMRTTWIEDACARIRRSHAGADVDHMVHVQQARMRLASSLPDLESAIGVWKLPDHRAGWVVAVHTRGLSLHLQRASPRKEEAASLIATLEKILQAVAASALSEDQIEIITRHGTAIGDAAATLGIPFRLPATLRWTTENQALRKREKKKSP